MIEITKTDRRHTGGNIFKYYAKVKRDRSAPVMSFYGSTNGIRLALLEEYDQIRRWCVDTWGMSCDRSHYIDLKSAGNASLNEHWCWHTEFGELKIYLVSEKDANWMKLRWS